MKRLPPFKEKAVDATWKEVEQGGPQPQPNKYQALNRALTKAFFVLGFGVIALLVLDNVILPLLD